jgi:hypothetical protein
MANAGRILIIPKGEWNADETYEMLDLVKHNGTSWLAKKTSVGIEPSIAVPEFWHDMFDFKEMLENIKTPIAQTYTSEEFSGMAKVLKMGSVVTVYLGNCVTAKDISGGTVLFSLEEMYRPSHHTYFGVSKKFMVNADTGEVKTVESIVKDAWIYESTTYIN